MNLRTLFAIPIAVILIVTVSLAGMVAGQGWSDLIRGRAAIEAVERMRLLLALQTGLRAERIVINSLLVLPTPLPQAAWQRLAGARLAADQAIRTAIADHRDETDGGGHGALPDHSLDTALAQLAATRVVTDQILARDFAARTLSELNGVMPRLLGVAALANSPLERASLAVTATDTSLSGLMTEDRLAESLRDQIGLMAVTLLPRYAMAEPASAAELERVRLLLSRSEYLTGLLSRTIETAGGDPRIRTALAELRAIDVGSIRQQLVDHPGTVPPQRIWIPWGERIDALRAAILDATVERVTARQSAREMQFDLLLTAFGAVMLAVLESVVLLTQRVVGPLAQLGAAITRIAAGDRSTPLTLHSGTREINEMVTAVETLRAAALVADATALRHRLAARQRLEKLREALGIACAVRGPAQALEQEVASLSDGIDATIALIATPPLTLSVAATAVRAGLADMRKSAAELEATFRAAAETDDRPEADFVAHILAVRAQVDRREAAIRGFVLPSLVGLRDAVAATGEASGVAVRELVGDQFARIEETVAVISSMLAAVTRASAIIHDLPREDDAKLAA